MREYLPSILYFLIMCVFMGGVFWMAKYHGTLIYVLAGVGFIWFLANQIRFRRKHGRWESQRDLDKVWEETHRNVKRR